MTPFHKLKGYERRIQEPGSSSRLVQSKDVVENSDLASSSIARACQLMSEAAQARPTTKMLDPELAPRIDAPSLPFQRIRKPLKIPRSREMESKKDVDPKKKKKRRPQPGKKWKKLVSNEEDSGMSRLSKHLTYSSYFLFMKYTWRSRNESTFVVILPQ